MNRGKGKKIEKQKSASSRVLVENSSEGSKSGHRISKEKRWRGKGETSDDQWWRFIKKRRGWITKGGHSRNDACR